MICLSLPNGAGLNPLRDIARTGVDSRIGSGAPKEIFNESSPPYTRKSSSWTYGVIGMSAICANLSVTLVTPEIVLYAIHNNPGAGASALFVAEDGSNTSYSRTIVSTHDLGPQLSPVSGDIGVALLNSPLPASVRPLRLFPENLMHYLPPQSIDIPIAESTSQNLMSITVFDNIKPGFQNFLSMDVPSSPPRSNYVIIKQTGDSGRAGGMIVNGELISILALAVEGGSGGTGWGNWYYGSAITAAIIALGSATNISIFNPASLQ